MLSIIATPIGNIKDISLRAIETLKNCDVIFCEDTRITLKLLSHYGISKPVHRYNDHASYTVEKIKEYLLGNKHVCLLSDSGMPNISDPGISVMDYVIKNNIKFEIIPGPSAVVSAVAGSGFDGSRFVFAGFLPRSKSKIFRCLENLFVLNIPVVVYESPYRLKELLEFVYEKFGNMRVVVARELTKMYEEWIRGEITEVLEKLKGREIKGEVTVIFKRETSVTDKPRSIMFVCTGNTCRSVMAHYYFKKRVSEKNISVIVSSSGICAESKSHVPEEVVKILAGENIEDIKHIPLQIDRQMIEKSDLILVMTKKHREILQKLFPEYSSKVYTLLEYAGLGNGDIYDPYGKSFADYEMVFRQIKKAVDILFEKVI